MFGSRRKFESCIYLLCQWSFYFQSTGFSMLNIKCSKFKCSMLYQWQRKKIIFYFIFNGLNWRAMRSRVRRQKGVSMI